MSDDEKLEQERAERVLREAFEGLGGVAHLSTLVAYVQSRGGRDGEELEFREARKRVSAALNRPGSAYERQLSPKGHWKCAPAADGLEEPTSARPQRGLAQYAGDLRGRPLCVALELALGSLGEGGQTVDALVRALPQHYRPKTPIDASELRELAELTLQTHPNFYADDRGDEEEVLYSLTSTRRRRGGLRSADGSASAPSDALNGAKPPHASSPHPYPSSEMTSSPLECSQCGAKAVSRAGTWKRDPESGQLLCGGCLRRRRGAAKDLSAYPSSISAASSSTSTSAFPASSTPSTSSGGKRVRSKATPAEDDEGDDEDGAWIQCDNCSNWLRAAEDGITDLSIYDDTNPNHLEYHCPRCRDELQALQAQAAAQASRAMTSRAVASSFTLLSGDSLAELPPSPHSPPAPFSGGGGPPAVVKEEEERSARKSGASQSRMARASVQGGSLVPGGAPRVGGVAFGPGGGEEAGEGFHGAVLASTRLAAGQLTYVGGRMQRLLQHPDTALLEETQATLIAQYRRSEARILLAARRDDAEAKAREEAFLARMAGYFDDLIARREVRNAENRSELEALLRRLLEDKIRLDREADECLCRQLLDFYRGRYDDLLTDLRTLPPPGKLARSEGDSVALEAARRAREALLEDYVEVVGFDDDSVSLDSAPIRPNLGGP